MRLLENEQTHQNGTYLLQVIIFILCILVRKRPNHVEQSVGLLTNIKVIKLCYGLKCKPFLKQSQRSQQSSKSSRLSIYYNLVNGVPIQKLIWSTYNTCQRLLILNL